MSRIPVTVIRHPKERLRKCSLRALHERPEFTFHKATAGFSFDATGYLLLAVDAPPLTAADRGPGEQALLVLDSTWRWLPELLRCITGEPIRRSLPAGIATAYPRVSRTHQDPAGGLASVEAVYLAKRILGEDDESLLGGYHWREQFLANVRGTER